MADAKYLVLSTMRDEGPYLLEWLAYHRAIGFTDFLIYSNDCRDGTDLLLDRLAQNGELTHERTKVLKRGPQKSAYKEAMQHSAYKNADWVYVADADEYLNIKIGSGHLSELLERFKDAEAIPVCWRLFSNSGHEEFVFDYTTSAYTDAELPVLREDEKGRFVKSIFRPTSDVIRIGTHAPVYTSAYEPKAKWGADWLDSTKAGDPRRPVAEFGYEVAQVNHYAVRSVNCFILKRDRGNGNSTRLTIEHKYWDRWCQGGSEDASIQRHLPVIEAEVARLKKDPVVEHLHKGAVASHVNRLDELLKRSDVQAVKDKIHTRAKILGMSVSKHSANPETQTLSDNAPRRHQNRLKMLEQMPKFGRCAEIGVWNGGFSAVILDVTKPVELNLIDPWELLADQSKDEWTHKRHQDHDFMQSMYQNVSDRYGNLGNVKIRKGFSEDVLSSFPDDYFDWVYIDGNHQYEFVKKDIELAFKKVRPGGIIAGDDFFWKQNKRMHVREAVLDAMRAHGLTNRPTRIGQQYMITTAA